MFELISQTPLPAIDGIHYRGIAYDGCCFYLTLHCSCTILQIDSCFRRRKCFEPRIPYAALCYDQDEMCFWATVDGGISTIYKLNQSFEEIDCIRVYDSKGRCSPILGLSYSCCDHSLIVAFAEEIIQVCPAQPLKSIVLLTARRERFSGVLSICPYLICRCVENSKVSIRIYSRCGELLCKVPLPCGDVMESAVFWPCVSDPWHCRILVLCTRKGCYPYLCDYELCCDTFCDTLCCCNYELCCATPCPEPCCIDACGSILESIALVEAAIAHILNSEGKKLQKAIASTDDVCELLAVNESINKTMNKAIYLEQLMCCKLENLEEFCGGCIPSEPCK